ncbi:hypothetical protein CEXT_735772 [Caerostris extrusa]|uniref:Uncharacterized protein n=1 Tax=Caerostris extrusa TaxID=172846 RepID=A0AAV4NYQ0_CAEEX|nr:hypothetical protein CEXT_735772 [Caerostris extrusa]
MCGTPSAKLSAVNSMSFRSRSARGSLKSGSNVNINQLEKHAYHSQPHEIFLLKVFNQQPSTPGTISNPCWNTSTLAAFCGICGFWKPRPSSAMVVQVEPDVPQQSCRRHSPCDEIKEEDEEEMPMQKEILLVGMFTKIPEAEDGV